MTKCLSSDPYDNIAPWYDPVTAWALAGTRIRMVELCRENGWRNVLDIGCGTGMQVGLLKNAGIRCCGFDASSAMLAVARERLPPGFPLVLGALPLPFADRFFDAAILSLLLHETDSEPEELLREALRVAPACVVLEWRKPERILELPGLIMMRFIERLAGDRHYARFRAYSKNGWLPGIAARAGASVVSEAPVCGGLLSLAVLSLMENIPPLRGSGQCRLMPAT